MSAVIMGIKPSNPRNLKFPSNKKIKLSRITPKAIRIILSILPKDKFINL